MKLHPTTSPSRKTLTIAHEKIRNIATTGYTLNGDVVRN